MEYGIRELDSSRIDIRHWESQLRTGQKAFDVTETRRRASTRIRVSQLRGGMWLTVRRFSVSCIDPATAGLFRPVRTSGYRVLYAVF